MNIKFHSFINLNNLIFFELISLLYKYYFNFYQANNKLTINYCMNLEFFTNLKYNYI